MRISILALLQLFCSTSFEQTNSYQNLIDTAFNRYGCLFVCSKPLQITRLDPKEIQYYAENLEAYSHQKLDTTMFSQIVENAKYTDTTLWSDEELPNFLLVETRSEAVSKKYAFQKFAFADDKRKRFYKKQINKFNATESIDRDISYFSRPVFDNSKTFAIIQSDNVHSYLGGGGKIILYQLKSGSWSEVGIILNWRY